MRLQMGLQYYFMSAEGAVLTFDILTLPQEKISPVLTLIDGKFDFQKAVTKNRIEFNSLPKYIS